MRFSTWVNVTEYYGSVILCRNDLNHYAVEAWLLSCAVCNELVRFYGIQYPLVNGVCSTRILYAIRPCFIDLFSFRPWPLGTMTFHPTPVPTFPLLLSTSLAIRALIELRDAAAIGKRASHQPATAAPALSTWDIWLARLVAMWPCWLDAVVPGKERERGRESQLEGEMGWRLSLVSQWGRFVFSIFPGCAAPFLLLPFHKGLEQQPWWMSSVFFLCPCVYVAE